MEFQIPITIRPPEQKITYQHPVLLMGSCFTENIGDILDQHKFRILQNPNGILFDPLSICNSLVTYIENKEYGPGDLIYLNEVWQSWQHHSRFSGVDKEEVLGTINQSQQQANAFLKNADWLVITVGTAYSYRLKNDDAGVRLPVANCHKAPANFFEKQLLPVEKILTAFDNCMHRLFHFNPKLKIIFTVSPVRHIRDGIVENNRSKARLLEAVHHMVNKFDRLFYFPAYELVMDVLRDYRFYEADMVHPNKMATEFIFDQFAQNYFTKETLLILQEIKNLVSAKNHKPFQITTNAHKHFLKRFLERTKTLKEQHPYLNLEDELNYFSEATVSL